MSTQPCRFGWDCARPNCWYTHPNGRAIDSGSVAGGGYAGNGVLQQQQTAASLSGLHSLPPHLQQMPGVINPLAFNPALLPLHMQSLLLSSSPPLPPASSPSPHSPSPPPPPSSFSSITKPITSSNLSSSSSSSPPPTSSSGSPPPYRKGPQPCRYGRDCRREECWFLHPDGREIDDRAQVAAATASGGGGAAGRAAGEDYDEALDEFEGKDAFSAEDEEEAAYRAAEGRGADGEGDDFVCPCCDGSPAGCTNTAQCAAAGLCVCQADRLDVSADTAAGGGEGREGEERSSGGVVDDTWKDEWFPASRECLCCSGYVYRCTRQQPGCSDSSCACTSRQQENGQAQTAH